MKKLKILVVDDEISIIRIVVTTLERCGEYEVLSTDDSKIAIQIMQENLDIDIVLTDLNMPWSIGGFEVLKAAKEILPEAKLFLMSGDLSTEIEEMAKKSGVERCFKKPMRIQTLLEGLRALPSLHPVFES